MLLRPLRQVLVAGFRRGVPWEAFHTHGAIDHYGDDTKGVATLKGESCCATTDAESG